MMLLRKNNSGLQQLYRKLLQLLVCVVLAAAVIGIPMGAQAAISGPTGLHAHKAYIAVDARDGKVLMSENADKKVYPASTTKLVMALAVMDKVESGSISLDGKVTITQAMINSVPSGVVTYGISAGQSYTLRTLLTCSLVGSTADTVCASAIYAYGSTSACVAAMNKVAERLELKNTHFDNVIGLDLGSGYDETYTTVKDMATYGRAAMSNQSIAGMVRRSAYTVCQYNGTEGRTVGTTNHLLTNTAYKSDKYTVIGVKTGTTRAAGYVLIAMAQDPQGHQVLTVYSGSYSDEARFYDTKKILDRAFAYRYTLDLSVPQVDTPKVNKPENVYSGIKVTWGSVEGAVKYRLLRKTAGGTWTKVIDTTRTSYIDRETESGTKYYYTVRCITANGRQYASSYNKTGRSILRLSQPHLHSVKMNSGTMKVTWDPVDGAEGYYVYRKTEGYNWVRVAEVTDTSCEFTGLKDGREYWFTVRAYAGSTVSARNSGGVSAVYYK